MPGSLRCRRAPKISAIYEVAPSRGGEQIDDVLDGFVGAVVGGFKSAVWAILSVRTAVEAAVGKWSAQPFVEEQKKQRDLNTL